MEHLPFELIGNILSRLVAARDVVRASATCRSLREAFRCHLLTLSFNSNDWPSYHDLTTSELEILITQTIFQTTRLQNLLILMDGVGEFSASVVISWLMHTRETLRTLFYDVRTAPNVNILEICGGQKLVTLFLAHNSITGVEPNYQRFSCLKSLILRHASISALDMSHLLTACPKIELLDLVDLEIAMTDTQATVELCSPTLKSIYVEQIGLGKVKLEADSLENLNLNLCNFERFELVGKGTLKHCVIYDVSCVDFDTGVTLENLEVVAIQNFTTMWPKFYKMISRSSKLRWLRLWNLSIDHMDDNVDLETFPVCFPQLSHLSLSNGYLRDGVFHNGLPPGSCHLENVIEMELGWIEINELFSDWVEGLVKRCPNLRKLAILGDISMTDSHEEYQMLANFTSSIVQLMRKYMQVEIRFVCW